MKNKRGRAAIAATVCCLILAAADCLAAVSLRAPERAARGDAFLATAVSERPVDAIVFTWRGKKISIPTRKNDGGRYEAEIMLAAPLDEKSGSVALEASDGSPSAARAAIALYDKKRPSQKLRVNRKFVQPAPEVQERIKADREKVRLALRDSAAGRSWSLPLERPVPGSVSSQFGMRRVFNGQLKSEHKGLDLRGAEGTPIKACADGRVALADNLYFSGNTVYVDHGDGVFTAYLHMSEPRVKTGDIVKKGDIVGLVGSTGRVTGPHLHLSLIVQGQAADPAPLLRGDAGAR